jgi:hypothetical protein
MVPVKLGHLQQKWAIQTTWMYDVDIQTTSFSVPLF